MVSHPESILKAHIVSCLWQNITLPFSTLNVNQLDRRPTPKKLTEHFICKHSYILVRRFVTFIIANRRDDVLAKCTVFCSAHHGGTTLTHVVGPLLCQSVRGLCTIPFAPLDVDFVPWAPLLPRDFFCPWLWWGAKSSSMSQDLFRLGAPIRCISSSLSSLSAFMSSKKMRWSTHDSPTKNAHPPGTVCLGQSSWHWATSTTTSVAFMQHSRWYDLSHLE
jgi:hypothetical protein